MQDNHTTQQLRTCSSCKGKFPATRKFFHADNRHGRSGLQAYCRSCASIAAKKYYRENKERIREQGIEYRSRTKEQKAERARKYYLENRERLLAEARVKNQEPGRKKRRSEYRKGYNAANREKTKSYKLTRRARIWGSEGTVSPSDIQSLYAAQEGRCAYCGVEVGESYHVDHIVPLSRGGGNGPDNLAIACPPCNLSKHNKLLEEWKAE